MPKGLDDDPRAVGEVVFLDGAAVDGGKGLLGEDVGVVGGQVIGTSGGVEGGGGDAGGVDDDAECPVWGVGQELGAGFLFEDGGDEGAGGVEGLGEVEAAGGRVGVGGGVGVEVEDLHLELGGEGEKGVEFCSMSVGARGLKEER